MKETYGCYEETSLKEVIQKLGKYKKHRAFVLDKENGSVKKVISLGDVLKVLFEHDKPLGKKKNKSSDQVTLTDIEDGSQKQSKKKKKDSSSSSSSSDEH